MSLSIVDDEHAVRRLKVIQRTSASQVGTAELCLRKWYFENVEGVRGPQTLAQARGTSVDDEYVQPYLRTGAVRTDGEHLEIFRSLIPHLPKHTDELLVQHRVELLTWEGGPTWLGFADWFWALDEVRLRVGDLKTTSDFRYCKSEAELRKNAQMISYAKAGYDLLDAKEVAIGHVYGRTKMPARAHAGCRPHAFPCACVKCKAWISDANSGRVIEPSDIWVSRDEVNQYWNGTLLPTVREMVEIATAAKTHEDVIPNTASCDAYGGCPHRSRCGLHTITHHFGKGKDMATGGLLARLRGLNGSNGASAQTAAPEVEEKPATKASPFGKKKSTEQAIECSACGETLDGSKLSRLQDGTIKHINCPGKPTEGAGNGAGARVLPPEVTEAQRASTTEDVQAAESKKKRGKKIKIEGNDGVMRTAEEHAEYEKTKKPAESEKGSAESEKTAESEKSVESEKTAEVEKTSESEKTAAKKIQQELAEHAPDRPKRKVPPQPLTIYVDCAPMKGATTSLETWLAPILELVEQAAGVADWRLIDFKAKGVLAVAIREAVDTTPSSILVDSRMSGAEVALECLIPYASQVVRGFR